MTTESAVELSRRRVAALALRAGGVLVWIAAGLHFFALPLLRDSVAPSLSGGAYSFVWPNLAFAFSLEWSFASAVGIHRHLLRCRNSAQ